MFKLKNIALVEATATLMGTIIGAGILGIPYIFERAGFWTGTLALIVVTLAMLAIKIMYGEVVLRTVGKHQIVGYTEIYLGKTAKYIMSATLIASLYGALLAYFIGQGQVIEALTGVAALWGGLVYYGLFSFFIYIGLRLIKRAEILLSLLLLAVMMAIGFLTRNHFDINNLAGFDWGKILVPYGVLLFASAGTVALPEMRLILRGQEKFLLAAIITGCSVPAIIYFCFAFLTVGTTGGATTAVASVGLGQIGGPAILMAANLFAFFCMSTSFLSLGLAQTDTFRLDYKLKKPVAFALAMGVPLALYFLVTHNFIAVIEIVGAVGIGINGMIFVLTYLAARKKGTRKPEYQINSRVATILAVILVMIFGLGIIYVCIR